MPDPNETKGGRHIHSWSFARKSLITPLASYGAVTDISTYAGAMIKAGTRTLGIQQEQQTFIERALRLQLGLLKEAKVFEMLDEIQHTYFPGGKIKAAFSSELGGFVLKSETENAASPSIFVGFFGEKTRFEDKRPDFVKELSVFYEDRNPRHPIRERKKIADVRPTSNSDSFFAYDGANQLSGQELGKRLRQQVIQQLEAHGHKPLILDTQSNSNQPAIFNLLERPQVLTTQSSWLERLQQQKREEEQRQQRIAEARRLQRQQKAVEEQTRLLAARKAEAERLRREQEERLKQDTYKIYHQSAIPDILSEVEPYIHFTRIPLHPQDDVAVDADPRINFPNISIYDESYDGFSPRPTPRGVNHEYIGKPQSTGELIILKGKEPGERRSIKVKKGYASIDIRDEEKISTWEYTVLDAVIIEAQPTGEIIIQGSDRAIVSGGKDKRSRLLQEAALEKAFNSPLHIVAPRSRDMYDVDHRPYPTESEPRPDTRLGMGPGEL